MFIHAQTVHETSAEAADVSCAIAPGNSALTVEQTAFQLAYVYAAIGKPNGFRLSGDARAAETEEDTQGQGSQLLELGQNGRVLNSLCSIA